MDVLYTHCAGLDVRKKQLTACRLVPDPTGQCVEGLTEIETFGTMTSELLGLVDWLTEAGITHVALFKSSAILGIGRFPHTPG